jgi:Holliday junction DNA helicase RuvB
MSDPRAQSKPNARLVTPAATNEDLQFDSSLRPRTLADFTGQAKVKEILEIAIESARRRSDAMDHVLLIGPPGLGKTTLANIISQELGVHCGQTSGPMLQKKLDLTGIMTKMEPQQVFFIDEIHRLQPDVEEALYSVIEDFRIDVVVGAGTSAQTHSIPIERFTIIGATTRQGLISAPLRSRFGLVLYLKPYDVAELTRIVARAARLIEATLDEDAAAEIARRSRGTPRIANRLLRRVRDYALVRATGHISLEVAIAALDLLDVDRYGLDEVDHKIMLAVLDKFNGGPVGLGTIAAATDEETDTIEEVYEPYLIQLGFLERTPRGRVGTPRAFDYFGIQPRSARGSQETLF